MQSIHSIETCAYGTMKYLGSEKEDFKFNNLIKQYKKWLKENTKNITPDHAYRILTIGDSGSGKFIISSNNSAARYW